MKYWVRLGAFAAAALVCAAASESDIVFRSDVSLIRVDVQVVDRNNRAITGLSAEDFVLRDEGFQQPIRNFATEDVPVDVLLLLDVSGSMRPHVERITTASSEALQTLRPKDRVGIMVFDRQTRLRLPFKENRREVEQGLRAVLYQESFSGGTDVTGALLEAGRYMERSGRADARRAIVILTDDQTERGRDEGGVLRALSNANAVLSALITRSESGGWGSSRGPIDIVLGRRGPSMRPRLQSAGTASIARQSGGDSFQADEGASLQTTLERIRQRYALHFHLPEGVNAGRERQIEVALSGAAMRRYPGAEVRYRRGYVTPVDTPAVTDVEVASQTPGLKRRRGVSEPEGSWRGRTEVAAPSAGGWRRADEPERSAVADAAPAPEPQEQPRKGWRKLKPGEEP